MWLPGILLLCTLALALLMAAAGRRRTALTVLGLGTGLFFVARAVAEPFAIDMTDPASYRNDWGGPHLAGVLAVHCGPGVIVLAVVGWLIARRVARVRTASRRDPPGVGRNPA
jgi:hypothetical protein